MAATTAAATTSLASLGLIADPQLADLDPTEMVCHGTVRRYRGVLPLVKVAVDAFNTSNVDAVVQLGDLIDGGNVKLQQTGAALNTMLNEFARCNCGRENIHHVVGNNELRNFSRTELESADAWIGRRSTQSSRLYYSFLASTGWRVIILNTFAVSVLNVKDGDEGAEQLVKRTLCAYEGFRNLSPGDDLSKFIALFPPWPNPMPSHNPLRRVAANNGACGDEQRAWLQQELRTAAASGEHVIVCGHNPVLPAVCNDLDSLAWDYDAVLELLRSTDGRACVRAYFAGHDHRGGYARDGDGDSGTHHVTMPAPLEAEDSTGSRFAVASLHADGGIELRGEGWLRMEPGTCLMVEAEASKVVGWERKGCPVLDLSAGIELEPRRQSSECTWSATVTT